MITIEELKQKYIDHLYDMNLSALNMMDLQSYGYAVKLADDMSKPTYVESMAAMMATIGNNGMCSCKAEDKAVSVNG